MSREGVMSFLQKLAVDETLQVGLNDRVAGKTGQERLEAVVKYAKTLDCEFSASEYGNTCETNRIATTLLGGVHGSGGEEWDPKPPPPPPPDQEGR